ncbi:MAG TPA: phenylalanine--tRNA ligase subunit alpha [Candidatus Sulfotelmatobacter sp.]|jgi:phenylalanyl-tRNA synthetase alpha chain|nr:phenylalanine--tRNA ligase subunit alpha [Candidatus Sulfotelmatobacter sp.]
MEEKLLGIKNNAISLILETKTVKELEEIRIQFLGRNGEITQLLKELPKIPKENRPKVGSLTNEVKNIIEDTIKTREATLNKTKSQNFYALDVSEPGIRPELGHLHLITQAIREITTIFTQIGFTRVRYPEIEWDWYAFTALNFPENHPARDDWETFFIKQNPDTKKGPVLLTPHTSSGQVREMEKNTLPIKMLNIAKTYRRQSDVSHTPMFHQFEGLVIGENIAISDLKGTLNYFVKSYFGKNRVSRIRPYHFQFTEPSFEVDISCGVCLGKGCRLCKEGWLELGGAGMVHPNVLKAGNVDPEKYTGFAFGWGVERVLMMKDGIKIDDLRTLYSNDLDFLKQF